MEKITYMFIMHCDVCESATNVMEMTDGRAVIQVCDTCRNYVVTMYLIHMDLKLAVEKVRPAFVKKDGFKDLVYTAPTERTYVKRKRVPKKKSLG